MDALDAEWLYSIIIFFYNTKHAIYSWVLILNADANDHVV
jgi:hypothetical protein